MTGSNSAERKRHEPLVLVETADLSEEDWLDYRRRGIGGSDVSAIFGTSPFRTARDLYYDKLNIASVEDDEGNWVAMEMGHLLEPLVAKIFERKTGYRVYQIKKMFQNPQYPWMHAGKQHCHHLFHSISSVSFSSSFRFSGLGTAACAS